MPVDPRALLDDCQRQVGALERDLKLQMSEWPELESALREEWQKARDAGRVGAAFEIWAGEQATQAAVHWVLGCVFVRFLEDNGLVAEPFIAGANDRVRVAEAHEAAFYGERPLENERHWLEHAFHTVASLPGSAMLFDETHNPLFRWPVSSDAAKALVAFWRRRDPETGALVHDFTDPSWQTRFLGDLYQDLSKEAKKKYALLQTPDFVEEFILDRTLGEAMRALPLEKVTVIDPTCGSGHFLLGAFARLLAAWEAAEPGTRREVLAQRTLDQVAGVDLNPFAVAIARFRLLIAAFRACEIGRLDRAPTFRLQVTTGDSLLHGADQFELALGDEAMRRRMVHVFSDEDLAVVNEILDRRYAVVVGNPPYIVPKDKALNAAYRARYSSCHMQYALSVPFIERFWQLASRDVGGGVAAWIGMINANSFMKREFGRKLIEEFLRGVDLTHVVDTAGAYIPGHGTPTAILFGRARSAATASVRAVMGVRGEPSTPTSPADGLVWRSIVSQIDEPGSESPFVSVADLDRAVFHVHPWALGGGGATDLKRHIDAAAVSRLVDNVEVSIVTSRVGNTFVSRQTHEIGVFGMTNADDVMLADPTEFSRRSVEARVIRPIVVGDAVRDWTIAANDSVIFPYHDSALVDIAMVPHMAKWLWPARAVLSSRATFGGGTYASEGRPWWEWHQVALRRLGPTSTITFGEVATHNHFVLSRGGVVFKQTAPVIKLPTNADENTHFGLLGLLNSSTACFWLKQVCFPKGGDTVGAEGARVRKTLWDERYAFNATNVAQFPVTGEHPFEIARDLDTLAQDRQRLQPAPLRRRNELSVHTLDSARQTSQALLSRMIALQEELDWKCYKLYSLMDDALVSADTSSEPPAIQLGERAFEIVLARRVAAGEEETTWFARHGSTPITEPPTHWPADYRALVERRIAAIESNRNIALIERPEYKRRWNVEPWEELERNALVGWLLDRLESPAYWPSIAVQTTRDLAARAAEDPDFNAVAALYGESGEALEPLIRDLVLGDAVPLLPAVRYSNTGREKRVIWERTWELQREEDRIAAEVAAELHRFEEESSEAYANRLAASQRARRQEAMDPIDRPPKYASADFASGTYWKHRGALDVPKERFILYSFCNREGDDAPVIGWAGWDHLQQANALAALYVTRTQTDGWQGAQLIPLLAGIAELIPWLLQWHNHVDPEYGQRLGDFYVTWLNEELQAQTLTRTDLKTWTPPSRARRPRRGR